MLLHHVVAIGLPEIRSPLDTSRPVSDAKGHHLRDDYLLITNSQTLSDYLR